MSLQKSYMLGLACAVGLGIAASSANAQVLYGKFNLPFEAKWGRAVLQPGEYKIFLPLPTSAVQMINVTGNGKTQYVMTATVDGQRPYGPSLLRLVKVGDAYFVKEFESGAQGKLFSFVTPRAPQETPVETEAGSQTTTVSVQ